MGESYLVLVAIIVFIWIALFWVFTRAKGRSRLALGILLAGPAFLLFRNRKEGLTARELLGLGALILFMLVIPYFTHWLES